MFSSPACDHVSDTLVNLIPVLKDTRWWNNSRLNMDLIGKGSMRDGFQSREGTFAFRFRSKRDLHKTHTRTGPAEVTYGVHILCAQDDLPFGSGTQQDYFNYLDYLNCVASRPEHNLLPLESCAEDSNMVNKITACTFGNSQQAWSNLEASYNRANDRGISLSPTMEIEWPSTMNSNTPSRVCIERTNENLEALICSAIVLSRAEDVSNSDILTHARTMIELIDNNCDKTGSDWGAVNPVCDSSFPNPFTASMLYALPVIILIVLIASITSCLRARFLMGFRRDAVSMNQFVGAFQLARLDQQDEDEEECSNRGINPLLLSALPITTPAELASECDKQSLDTHCTICLDDLDSDESIYKLKCSHVFHRSCLKEWAAKKNECPVCRTKLYDSSE